MINLSLVNTLSRFLSLSLSLSLSNESGDNRHYTVFISSGISHELMIFHITRMGSISVGGSMISNIRKYPHIHVH